jgi:phosphohistidine phosphatase
LLETWLEQVGQQRGDRLILVGHAPDLSQWAERLLWNATKETIVLKKAGIIGLSLPETGSCLGHSQLIWLTPPRFLL